jgi:enoyl-CoA hydratase
VSFSSDRATYNAPEMNHNILPTMVMSSLFDRVSRNAIAYLVYSTDFVDAQRALSYGLVSTVVADDKLDATLDAFLANMVNTPRPALMGLKEYLRVAPNMDAQGGIDLARSLHAVVNTSGEMKKKKRHH